MAYQPKHATKPRLTTSLSTGIALVTAASFTLASVAIANADTVHEDEPGWVCAEMGNQVCGPFYGPNHHGHNHYYGTGEPPYIPGRTTLPANHSR